LEIFINYYNISKNASNIISKCICQIGSLFTGTALVISKVTDRLAYKSDDKAAFTCQLVRQREPPTDSLFPLFHAFSRWQPGQHRWQRHQYRVSDGLVPLQQRQVHLAPLGLQLPKGLRRRRGRDAVVP